MTVGQTHQLGKIVEPSDALVTWHSRNEHVAKVENGKITALSPGTTVIWIEVSKFDLVETAAFTLTVIQPEILNKPTNNTLKEGQTHKVSITSGISVSWKSSDSSVASIDSNGTITAFKEGTTTISAYNSSKTIDSFVLTVHPLYVEGTHYILNENGHETGNYSFYVEVENEIHREYISEAAEIWNNAGVGVNIYEVPKGESPNCIKITDDMFMWPDGVSGLYTVLTRAENGRAKTFNIQLCSKTINVPMLNSQEIKTSYIHVLVHELGHSFGLSDQPPTSYSSIMKYYSTYTRATFCEPHPCDLAGVKKFYGR